MPVKLQEKHVNRLDYLRLSTVGTTGKMLVRERKCADIFRDLIVVEITFFLDGIIFVGNCIGVSIYRTYKSKVHKESVYYVLDYCTTVVVQYHNVKNVRETRNI